MNRLDTLFGSPGWREPARTLKPFDTRYKFAGRVYGPVIWARDEADAREYCAAHGLQFDGEIVETVEL